MKLINLIFWVLLIIGTLGLLLPSLFGGTDFIKSYTALLQFYLLGFTAFLVLKRVFFYRLKGDINIVKLVKTSDLQQRLLIQGATMAVLFVVYTYLYDNLLSFNSIMIGILFFYYSTQVLEHGHPSIYLDDVSFSYDDYLVQQWPWQQLQAIRVDDANIRLIGQEGHFELDFESIDEIDFVRLDDELERSILDGEFASSRSSNSLKDIIKGYATTNDIDIKQE